jgi:predicted acyl esterase
LRTLLILTFLGIATAAMAQRTEPGLMGQGTEDRDWIDGQLPDPTSPVRYTYQTYEHVKIPMRDGVHLDALVYIPDVPEPGPCILVADGYGWSYDSRDRRFVERGYALVNASMRGIGESEGEAGLYNEMARDGYDLVEWMAAQPWCDGNVGAFGSSLPGIPLWQIAREAPPSLKAIAPDVACGNCYEYLWYPGGMLPGPGRMARGAPEYPAAIEHRDYDDWWRDRSTTAVDHAAMAKRGFPILATGGWEDYITSGNIQAFEEYARAGGVGRLIISPGAHLDARRAVLGPHHHEQHMDLFFDHYLRGEHNQWVDGTYRGNVIIWVNGPNRYRYEKTWPIPDTREARLYFRDQPSGTIASRNDGSLSAVAPRKNDGSTPASYEYFPDTGPFLRTMRQSSQGMTRVNQVPYESATVTWTTDVLEVPTEVTGKLKADFWAAASAEDTDFVLMVSDVAPDGTSRYITSGYLNAPRNASRSTPDPLVPGEIRPYHLETQPISYVFQPGHRIRVSIAGGTERAPEQNSPQGPGKNPNAASVTIYQDADHPSSITFPIIGTALLPTELTDKRECMDGGWEAFGFRNQGQCVSHIVTGKSGR